MCKKGEEPAREKSVPIFFIWLKPEPIRNPPTKHEQVSVEWEVDGKSLQKKRSRVMRDSPHPVSYPTT